ncbi:hypothetical protein [Methylophaga frappieri]|uniref:hypothetical protein n=1 Tax=Methylophaga frappieri (strain ATCC BAA-2434 / DSM 25690 / JAM7) TaxID=754477 RepID=UPI00059CF1AC|nr:hypothetical protein [Methylophaga frappieri]
MRPAGLPFRLSLESERQLMQAHQQHDRPKAQPGIPRVLLPVSQAMIDLTGTPYRSDRESVSVVCHRVRSDLAAVVGPPENSLPEQTVTGIKLWLIGPTSASSGVV